MECKIVLEIGGQKQKIIITSEKDISKLQNQSTSVIQIAEDASEPKTIEDIITLLKQKLKPFEQQRFLDALFQSTPNLTVTKLLKNGNTINKITLLDNCSFDRLKTLYPAVMRALPKDKIGGYHISLITGGTNNGEVLRGRVFANGVENFILRNEQDVKNFAITEAKKNLVNQQVNGNEILDEDDRKDMLRRRYEEKLKVLVEYIKTKKDVVQRIKDELGMDVTIQSVALDYLNHKSEYTNYYTPFGNSTIQARVVLRDFVGELNMEKILYQDSESDLAAALRGISVKRTNLGKKSLYELLSSFNPDFTKQMPISKFVTLNKEEMEGVLKPFFDGDPLLQNFEIENVDKTKEEKVILGLNTIKAIYKKNVAKLNKEDTVGSKIEASYEDVVKTVDDAKKYIGSTYTVDGVTYNLNIRIKDNKLEYSYQKRPLTDDHRIKVKYKGSLLSEQFNFSGYGYDTWNVFQNAEDEPGVEDPVINGMYHGYHIYQTGTPAGKQIFIVSKSIVSPNLYVSTQFSSLSDAKAAVIGYNYSSSPAKATMFDLKTVNAVDKFGRKVYLPASVNLGFFANTGQIIESLNYYLPPNSEKNLQSQERELYNDGNLRKVIDFYAVNFSIPRAKLASVLDTPEKAGIFILEMANNNLSYQETKTKKRLNLEQRQIIENIFNQISNAKTKQYLVRRTIKGNTYQTGGGKTHTSYITYLQAISDAGMRVNSMGITTQNKPITQSLTTSLFNLQRAFNEGLLKDSGIEIVITDNDSLANDEEFKQNGESIFGDITDMSTIKGFVYNNKIYINQSSIQNAANSMFHEVMHITFGAIRANDTVNGTNNYEKILEYFSDSESRVVKNAKEYVEANYPKLAYQDKLEEVAVRVFARNMENTSSVYLSEKEGVDGRLVKDIMSVFADVNRTAREALTMDFSSDMAFQTSYHALFNDDSLSKMAKQRIVANLIEKGIKNETIIEDCK